MNRLILLLSFVFLSQQAVAGELTEKQKIQHLVSQIQHVDGVFVRNGSEHSAKEASDHIQKKINYAGDRIKTARQFIDRLGSRSYFTGTPYYIRFNDGKEKTTRYWLLQQLYYLEEGLQLASITPAHQG